MSAQTSAETMAWFRNLGLEPEKPADATEDETHSAADSYAGMTDIEAYARVLNYQPGERVSLNRQLRPGGRFESRIIGVGDLPAAVNNATATACYWVGFNPTTATTGRGTLTDVSRLAAMHCELDDKNTSLAQRESIIDTLTALFGAPSMIVGSGHGVHLYWAIADGDITDGFTTGAAAELLVRFGRIVSAVAAEKGAGKPDAVWDITRVLRAPGTTNYKDINNPVQVTLTVNEAAQPLTVPKAEGCLNAAEALYPPPAPRNADVPATRLPTAYSGESAADRYNAEHTWRDVLEPHGWTSHSADPDADGAVWLHPTHTSDCSATVRHGCLFVHSTSTEFDVTYPGDPHGYTKFRAYSVLNFGGNMSAAAKTLVGSTSGEAHGNTDFGYGPQNEATADVDAETDIDETGATWRPIDLGPYLRGEIISPKPTLGIARDDGQRCLYPGREHAVIGETESGKSWFCLMCSAAEMRAGNRVVYIHFEEADPASTIERLQFLGLPDDTISGHLVFLGPGEQVRREWLTALMQPPPTLVILDGVNEAMALHGAEIKAAEGASEFRRRLVTPFLRAGAAVLSCDHLPMGTDHTRRDAYGTVHKGNAIDGARFVMVNKEPFGRGMRGMSHVYLTKDRPGALRIHGRQTGVPGKSYFGALAIDATGNSPELWGFYPPRDTDQEVGIEGGDAVAEAVLNDLAKAGGSVDSFNKLCAMLRTNGMGYQRTRIRDAVDDLVVATQLLEVPGARGAVGYRLPDSTGSATGSGAGSDEVAA